MITKRPNIKPLLRSNALQQIFYVLFLFLVAEGTLRLQQKLGPLSDLEFRHVSLEELSPTLNHVPPAKSEDFILREEGKEIRFAYEYDKNGIRVDRLRPDYSHRKDAFKVLFMGDSFMQGNDLHHTIPQHIWDYFQQTPLAAKPLVFYNAGYSSYSPAIFVPQAKKLIPLLKPDFVVVDVDETDLGDDFIRYKDLIVRDPGGSIAAVRPTPVNYENLAGYLRIRTNPSYLVRYFLKIYHRNIRMPALLREYRKKDHRDTLSISADMAPDAAQKYSREIEFFEKDLDDLARTLVRLTGGPQKILFLYHPHLEHLKPDARGRTWNHFVSDGLARVAVRYGIGFYNATGDLKEAFHGEPEKYYWKGDMHFNFTGLEIYAQGIAKKLLPVFEAKFNSSAPVS